MKDILVFLSPAADGDSLSDGALYAIATARMQGAHLTALIADIESGLHDLPPEPDIRQIERPSVKPRPSRERVARTAEVLKSAAKDAGVPCDTLQTADQSLSLREQVIASTQVHDILIVDVRGPLLSPCKDHLEAALFAGGRPVVLVPPGRSAVAKGRIMVAWDGTRSAVRAVHDALPLLVEAREVGVVSVIDDKQLPAPHSGPALCRYLARWHVDASFSTVQRETLNIGRTLLAQARQAHADLLVMGAFAHAFERSLMLGSATRDIFDATIDVPVLLSH